MALQQFAAMESECMPDGPVPGFATSGVCGDVPSAAHEVERAVQRALFSLPDVEFCSLQIHRFQDGVCLTGVVNVTNGKPKPQFERVAGSAAGVCRVINQLVVKNRTEKIAS
ncbi:BON domain-containing protein [Planctomicrobium piriforme]|nr:BON domain-containing protein [Planctomicrobium piriforme]